ncbi:hypothetical protein AMJ86_01110 [bacterium SM23_57]|nr:MAG: hypothetical protein AMJ86_01110 [bacterium SM23_57]
MNPVVYGCLDQICGAAKKINIVLTKNGEVVESPSGKELLLVNLLLSPNPNEGQADFIEHWMLHMNIAGMAYVRAIAVGNVRVEGYDRAREGELWLIRPDKVQIVAVDKLVDHYVYNNINFSTDELYHWQYPDPLEDFQGMPPLRAVARAVDAHNKLYQWNDAIFDNHGVPAGIVGIKGLTSLSEDTIKQLLDDWEQKYGGAQNAGKVAFLPGEGMDYTQLSFNPRDLDWLGGEGMLARRICNVFSVPSQLLGDPDTSKYSNYKEARQALYHEKVIPDMEKFIDGINKFVIPKFGLDGYAFELGYGHIQALREDENQLYTRLNLAVWMTVNEKRQAVGLDDIKGGDVVLIPFNLIPLSSGGKPAEDEGTKFLQYRAKPNGSLYPTQKDRVAAFLRNEERRQQWERRYKTAVVAHLDGQKERVLDALDKWKGSFTTSGMEYKLNADQMNLFDEVEEGVNYANEMHAVNVGLIVDFGQAALDEVGLDALFNINRPGVEQWLAENLARNGKNISVATANEIKRVVNEGLKQGEGISKLADRIEDLYSGFSRNRALTIARTEVGGASGKAKLEGYVQGGVSRKEWLSAFAPTSRDSHMAADGQVVNINEPFSIDGSLTMTAPCQTGVAEHDINCLCTMAPLGPGEGG